MARSGGFMGRTRGIPLLRQAVLLALAILILGLGASIARPSSALGFVSGQERVWGEFGTEPGKLFDPKFFGADPVDGSVYVTTVVPPEFAEFRIQKFTNTGTPPDGLTSVPSASLARTPEGTGRKAFIGIAVDHSRGRFYVLQDAPGVDTRDEVKVIARKILVFSTTPNPITEKLEQVGELDVSAPEEANTLFTPREIAVDPTSGDVIVLGENLAGQLVVQRIKTTGSGGVAGEYVETGSLLSKENIGIAVASDGTVYVLTAAGQGPPRAYTLPPGFSSSSTLVPVSGFEEAAVNEGWASPNAFWMFTSPPTGGGLGRGPQVAISETSTHEPTIYWKTQQGGDGSPGSYVIHGYSVADKATSVAYGAGPSEASCRIETAEAALAGGPDDSLFVFDQGEQVPEGQEPLWGPNIFQFGPGGSERECPAPAAAIKAIPSSIGAGQKITLDASESEPKTASSTEMEWTWKLEGPGGTTTLHGERVETAELTETGPYTVRLNMKTPIFTVIGTNFVAKAQHFTVTGSTTHTLAVTKTGIGSGTVQCKVDGGAPAACPTSVADGAGIEVIATPDAGSELGPVTGTGSAASCTALPCTFTVTANSTLDVEMKLSGGGTTHTLAVTKTGTGSGTVQCKVDGGAAAACPTSVTDGAGIEVIATPNGSSELGTVSGTGSAASCTALPCTLTVTANSSVTVEFKTKPAPKHKVTVNKVGEGSGAVQCNGGACAEYTSGTELTLTAVPDAGSTFGGWEGSGCTGTATCKIVIGSADVTVVARFNKAPSTSPGPNPTPTPTPTAPSNTVKPGAVKAMGSTVSLTVTVPGPGALAASGKGLISTKVSAKGAGAVHLKLKLTSAEKKKLAKKGKVTIKVKVVFTPVGGTPGTTNKTITIKAKKSRHRKAGAARSAAAGSLFGALLEGCPLSSQDGSLLCVA